MCGINVVIYINKLLKVANLSSVMWNSRLLIIYSHILSSSSFSHPYFTYCAAAISDNTLIWRQIDRFFFFFFFFLLKHGFHVTPRYLEEKLKENMEPEKPTVRGISRSHR